MPPLSPDRRRFLASSLTAATGLTILPGGTLFGQSANSRLNIALIGAHGRGEAHYANLKGENVVALCDVDANHLALAAKEFPGAKTYTDWRRCLEQKDLEAVVCCTPDHHHAFICIWAMNRGLHVFCEKPLGDSVEEARAVRAIYLRNRDKLATQHGTQRRAYENFDRVAELVHRGAIGELQDVHAFGDRFHGETAYRPAAGAPPSHLDWEQWVGPVQMHPYNPAYFGAPAGMNCLHWNMFDDFGSWQIGDMGSHVMDLAWTVVGAGIPTTVAAEGDPYNPAVCPSALRMVAEMPANDRHGPIRVLWYQGGPMPASPHPALDLAKIGHGVVFKGSRGVLVSGFGSRLLIPSGGSADLSYFDAPTPEEVAPPIGDFGQEWIRACKGDLRTSCDFDHAGQMIETLLLGLAAHRAGRKLAYDAAAGVFPEDPEATTFLRKHYRPGWSLDG
jgi:predicted dehydrogenase